MTITDALAGVRQVFLDTAPVIYHVEGTAAYQPLTDVVFQEIRNGLLFRQNRRRSGSLFQGCHG
jgi:hypothetical protein